LASNELLRSERIQAALDSTLAGGDQRDLLELIERSSGYPGPRPNVDLAKAVGAALAGAGKPGLQLTTFLLADKNEYFNRIGLMALATRASNPKDKSGAFDAIHDRADEPRKSARDAVIDAVSIVLVARGEEAVPLLAAYTDGYLHAYVALEALTRRVVLDRLTSPAELLLRLGEAFDLADVSPRAAERSQGVRLLREGFPGQISRTAHRFEEVLDWLEIQLAKKRPETRQVLEETLVALRKASLSEAATARLRAVHAASAPIPRDLARIVQGTRKRGRGR
jgi:hypothetical protein